MTAKKKVPEKPFDDWSITMAEDYPKTSMKNPVSKEGADKKDNPNKEAESKSGMKAPEGTVLKVEEKDDVATVTSATADADLEAIAKQQADAPQFVDLTQSFTGVVGGQTGYVAGGALQGDGSYKDDRKAEDVEKEVELKAGPNPTPNREGNELTKAANFLANRAAYSIPERATKLADDIKSLTEKASKEDKAKAQKIEDELRHMGRV